MDASQIYVLKRLKGLQWRVFVYTLQLWVYMKVDIADIVYMSRICVCYKSDLVTLSSRESAKG